MRIILLLAGYAFGLIQNGHYISSFMGVDITRKGSGNVGATNVVRVMGTKTGVLVFVLDFLKGFIPALAVSLFFRENAAVSVYVLYIGFGVILGHCFPVQFGFRGGKGISSAIGFILVYDWRVGLGMIVIFLLCVVTSRYISLGSVVAAIAFPVLAIIFRRPGAEEIILIIIMVCIVLFRHGANIKRLLSGTENKFSFSHKTEK